MKYIFIIALLCATFVSFSQIDTRFVKKCGFSTSTAATQARFQVFVAPDEVILSEDTYQDVGGGYCYTVLIRCAPPEPISINKEKKESKPMVLEVGCKNDPPAIALR